MCIRDSDRAEALTAQITDPDRRTEGGAGPGVAQVAEAVDTKAPAHRLSAAPKSAGRHRPPPTAVRVDPGRSGRDRLAAHPVSAAGRPIARPACFTCSVEKSDEIQRLLDGLADDVSAAENRVSVCETIGQALVQVGKVLWVTGYIVGSDRKSGTSPFRFGNDSAVGVATVAQIGGELAIGASDLLKTGNCYAACALIRQLVEVEYLAEAFAREHDQAAEWLRADREQRRQFWSPGKLRQRAPDGLFLASDY